MNKVTLYDLARDRTIELTRSSTITVGRGFFECQDKRVSRKHGEITVMENQKVKVKACHTNPIFYKVNGSLQSQILNKDNEVELKNSDKFSLLPNSEYEYEVKITHSGDDEDPVEPSASTSTNGMRVRNVGEINVNLQAGNMATSLSQIIATSANEEADTTNGEGVETNRVQEDMERTPSPDMLVAPSDFVQASPSRAGRKRSIEGNAEGSEESNKRVKSSTDPENAVSCSTTSAEPTGSDDNVQTVNPPAVFIKPDPDSTSVSTSVATSTSTSVTTSSSSSTTAPKIKPDPDGSPSTTTGATAAASSTDAVKKENPNTSPSQSAQATPTATSGLRPSCEFGIRCYRNTPDHMRDVAHPADADYRRPTYPAAPASAPNCPWGASCYRRNPDHFRQLQHPSSSTVYSTQPVVVRPVRQLPLNVLAGVDGDSDDEEDFDDSEADMDFIDDEEDLQDEDDNEDGEENNLEE